MTKQNKPKHNSYETVLEVRDLKEKTKGIGTPDLELLNYNGQAFWRGWTKFFKVIKGEKPKSFFKNPNFKKQMRENPSTNLETMDNGNFLYIRNDNLFFVSLLFNNINIASSRINSMMNNFDSLFLDHIIPVAIDNSYEGGIQDFGSFSEGYCFKVVISDSKLFSLPGPKVKTTDYVFCCASKKEKEEFMGKLKKLKSAQQSVDGIIITKKPNLRLLAKKNFLQDVITPGNYTDVNNKTVSTYKNGKWIILQDWSECSLKCGGGTTVLHRFCVPPEGDGKPCEGDAILIKKCNTHPCRIVIFLFLI
jgi:hypothetical protein